MLIWTGTATVTNGDATVVVDTGAALTAEVVAQGAMVVLDGVVYFADSLTDTTTLEMTRVYAGSTGTADMEIWPVSQDTTNLVNLAQIVARTQAQINILDKNSQGLFFMMKGVTGAADPGPGFIAFDDADATLVTEAYIDALDANGRAVSELVGLWEAGTTIVVRSLSTTAYRAYTVATNTAESGWATLALTYVGHDGVLADNEALAVSWSRAAAGLEINATGNFVDRDLYDDEPAGFVFLSADGDGDAITASCLFRKNSATTADWGPAVPFQGPQGARGWAPVFAVVNDGTRRVLRLVDYVGGENPKPTTGINQYVSAGGLTGTIGSATDIRGPIGMSAYEVAVAQGFVGDETAWLASLNGADGDDGVDGTDPGILLNFDDTITDADPGAGNFRADNADLSAATFLYVSKTNRAGDDISAFLAGLADSTNPVKGILTLTRTGGNAQAIFNLTGMTDATGYVKLAVADHSGATGFIDADAVSLQFTRSGDQGSADAISVASAINGAPEVTAPDPLTKIPITDPDNSDLLSWITIETLAENIAPPPALVDAKTSSYTVLESDVGKVLSVSASAAARTITLLPAATAGNGFPITVKKSDSSANTVTIDGDGTETIDGALTRVLRLQYQAVRLVSDGTNWQVVEEAGVAVDPIEQLIIGGDFPTNPWQRGVSFTAATELPNNDDVYTADMFNLISDGNDIVDITRDTDGSFKFEVETANKKFGLVYFQDATRSAQVIGDVISVAANAKASGIAGLRMAVLSWTGTADTITSDVVSAWGAAGVEPTWAANWTREGSVISLSLSASYQSMRGDNIAIDTASAKQFAVVLWVDDTDATVNDTLNIKWVSAVAGAKHPDRPPRLANVADLCLEYAYVMDHDADGFLGNRTAIGLALTTTIADFPLYFLTRMRATPTSTVFNPTLFQATNGAGTGITAISVDLNSFRLGTRVRVTVASGLTVGQGSLLRFASAGARFLFNANL